MRFSIGQKGLVMVGVPLALNLFVLAGLGYLLNQEHLETLREEKGAAINQRADDMRRLCFAASHTAFKYSLSGNAALLSQYKEMRKQIDDNYNRLLGLISDDPKQVLSLRHIYLLELRGLKVYDAAALATQQGRDGFTIFRDLQLAFELQTITKQFIAETERFLIRTESQRQSVDPHRDWLLTLKTFLFASVAANIGLGISLAVFFGRNFADRLRLMIANTVHLAGDRPLNPIVSGNDEISSLDAVYHEMANVLKEARRKERIFIDNAADIICTIDEKLKFTEVSPACELVWGYSPSELIGRSVAAISSSEDLTTAFLGARDRSEAASEMNFENKIKHKDGRLVDTLWSIYWSTDERTYFCVAHDITESKAAENLLKESEARILAIIENMPVGLLIHDSDGHIELTNKKVEEMLMLSGRDLLDRNVSAFFKPVKQEKSAGKIEEISCLRDNGQTLPIELHVNELYYQNQMKNLAILVDVSERHQLENARKELVHMVSHDLRTPLTNVEAIMDLLVAGIHGQLTDEEKDMAVKSKQELHRLLALLNGLLDLEKIQAGALELDREVNSSLLIVNDAIDSVVDFARKSAIPVTNHAEDCELFCDAGRLVEVIVLFVMDALRKIPTPEAIDIYAQETEAASGTQFKVVSRHAQSTTSGADETPGHSKGTGLWLVICNGIVKGHEGWLEICKNDQETVYTFTIPQPELISSRGGD